MIFDDNVLVKWIVDEEGSAEARAASSRVVAAAAPAHAVVETGRALLKYVRRGSISSDDALASLGGIIQSVELIPTETLIDEAFQISLAASVTIYDALYLAAALRRRCLLVTADARLVNGVNSSEWRGRAVLLGSLAESRQRDL